MKLGLFRCSNPACNETYDGAIFTEIALPCPTCGQRNMIQAVSPTLTGRCEKCKKPIDDHSKKGNCP